MFDAFDWAEADSHLPTWRAFGAHWRKPLQRGAARIAAGLTFQFPSGIADLRGGLMRGGEPEAPSCRARPHVDFVGSATWSDPPGSLLLGVVTITGASCRRHLLDGSAALLSALDNERGPACAPGPVFPSADQLLRVAETECE